MSRVKKVTNKKKSNFTKVSLDKRLIVIAGPTASGKTDMAVFLAKKFNGEVINADSRQVYKEMEIGTGCPTIQEMKEIPHHLFNIKKPDQTLTLADFQKLANKKIKEIWARGKVPFLVGGTGLYIDAVVYKYKLSKINVDLNLRAELEKKPLSALLKDLKKFDLITYEKIDHQNKRRIVRALEATLSSGLPFSAQNKKSLIPKNTLYLAIDVPREKLYEKINKRVEVFLKKGFEKEARNLLQKYSASLPALSGIGYGVFANYFNNEITKKEAIEKFKQGDRNLAKKQLTWFRKNKDIVWIKNKSEAEKLVRRFLVNS